jgi:hypothetical protein
MLLLYMYWVSSITICEKKSNGTFLFIGFWLFLYPFSAIFSVFHWFLPWCTLLISYYTPILIHWTCNQSWLASNNVLFCLSRGYHSHLSTPYLAQILGLWVSIVESKWCHYIMVEADSHLKLLPKSILDISKVFEHIDMLSMGMQ